MQLTYCGLSDIGISRPNNEDVWAALPHLGFFALADGMGGHQAGEIAAHAAINSLCNSVQKFSNPNISCMELIIELRHAIEQANAQVIQMAKSEKTFAGMGTTLCCLLWTQEAVVYAHVGDSRIYRLRRSKLELLTEDHSFLAKWKSLGKLAENCETPYPYRNVITRAVGTSGKAKPEISLTSYLPGDIYFLCTDGLSDVLALQEMESLVNSASDLEEATATLVEMAKMKGSPDNITLLMVKSKEFTCKEST